MAEEIIAAGGSGEDVHRGSVSLQPAYSLN
jgi:hypothetical protein